MIGQHNSFSPFVYPIICSLAALMTACQPSSTPDSYQTIFNALQSKTELLELTAHEGQARLMISPTLQGRIITTSAQGLEGPGNGWINQEKLKSSIPLTGGIGGEDRVWIGPLGSQYSFYYQQIKPLAEENWQVPATMEGEPYEVVSQEADQVHFRKDMSLTNFQGSDFHIRINRYLHILNSNVISQYLGIPLPDQIDLVAFESRHALINQDTTAITPEKGMVSIWSAGMFAGTDRSTVIIPLNELADTSQIWQYMGKMDNNRLRIEGQTLYFKADGKYRSKIGIPPALALPLYGCYSPEKQRLTIVQYQTGQDTMYFNSAVSIQEAPYQGEVIPIYNNGPMSLQVADVASFYELESTSPMRPLVPGDSLTHFHRVYHFVGPEAVLEQIAGPLLNINLQSLSR